MVRRVKILIVILGSIILGYYGYSLINFAFSSHDIEQHDYKRYMWIFKDSVKSEVDTFVFSGLIRPNDVLYKYIYKNSYYISIWEFKELRNIELRNIPINFNVNLDNIKFTSGEVFNKDSSPLPLITMKLGFHFNNSLAVNLDARSKIIRSLESAHYKGFYGVLNEISFSNEKDEHLIVFDYPSGKESTLLLLYKANNSFYVVMVHSDKPVDENIIKILNLP